MATKQDHNPAWARRISALMEAAKIEPEELAKRMRISRATAYAWRAGTRVPSRDMQPRLAKQLGVTVAELNGWAA